MLLRPGKTIGSSVVEWFTRTSLCTSEEKADTGRAAQDCMDWLGCLSDSPTLPRAASSIVDEDENDLQSNRHDTVANLPFLYSCCYCRSNDIPNAVPQPNAQYTQMAMLYNCCSVNGSRRVLHRQACAADRRYTALRSSSLTQAAPRLRALAAKFGRPLRVFGKIVLADSRSRRLDGLDEVPHA